MVVAQWVKPESAMPSINANAIDIEYDTFGSTANETVLLIMGLGSQLIHWPESLCRELVDRGFHVVRYDHRDIGLSTKLDRAGIPNLALIMGAKMLGWRPRVPYGLLDMAADGVGLLDALGIAKAHIVGASMGGMIAQLIAAHYPDKALSLTSIMSTTGHSSLPSPRRDAMAALTAKPVDPNDREAVIQRGIQLYKTIGSPGYPTADEVLRMKVVRAAERSYYPAGRARHLAASVSAPHRRRLLKSLDLPAVVLHGEDDPLIPVACGIDTAKHIPNAELRIIPGMGHDFPDALMPVFADAIETAAKKSR